jgi:hypothetical protein
MKNRQDRPTDILATLIIAVRRGRLVTGSLDWPADLGHL